MASSVIINNLSNLGKTPQPGDILYGDYSYDDLDFDPQENSYFQWRRIGDDINGATAQAYTVQTADVNQPLDFQVIPKSAEPADPDTGSPAVSPPINVIAGSAPVAKDVSYIGETVVGKTLTGQYTYYDADGDAQGVSTFRWYRNWGGSDIPGATGLTYTLTTADEGAVIWFGVTPVAATGAQRTGSLVWSPASPLISPKPGSAPTASNVVASGTPKIGMNMTGSYKYYDADGDAEKNSKYVWYRGWGAGSGEIPGANGITYTLTSADIGQSLWFGVYPKSATGTPKDGAVYWSQEFKGQQ